MVSGRTIRPPILINMRAQVLVRQASLAFALAVLVVAVPGRLLRGQCPAGATLEVRACAGSTPGPLTFEFVRARPFSFVIGFLDPVGGAFGLPGCPCILDVGPTSLTFIAPSDANGSGSFLAAPLPVPSGLAGIDLRLQAVTVGPAPCFLDEVSPVAIARLQPAGSTIIGPRLPTSTTFALALPTPNRGVVVAGGSRGGLFAQIATDATSVYDPVANMFSSGPTLDTPRGLATATELQDGRWLLAGGVDDATVIVAAAEIYDPSTMTFTATGSMVSPRAGHTASLLADGRVFVAGGASSVTTSSAAGLSTTEIFDPVTGQWSSGPNLSSERIGHVAVLRPSGGIALLGGTQGFTVSALFAERVLSTIDLVDSMATSITLSPRTLQSPRALPASQVLANGTVLLAGGVDSLTLFSQGSITASAEIYDPATDASTSIASMATPRGQCATYIDQFDRVVVAGGGGNRLFTVNFIPPSVDAALVALDTVEIWDPSTGTWSAGASLPVPVIASTVATVGTGQILFAGGDTNTGPGPTTTTPGTTLNYR